MQKRDPAVVAGTLAQLVLEEHGTDVRTIDMRPVASYTDFFVICTGRNQRLTRAIADKLVRNAAVHGLGKPRRREADADNNWLLLDWGDVVLHIFTPDARAFYRLESLWGQLPQREHHLPEPAAHQQPEAAAG